MANVVTPLLASSFTDSGVDSASDALLWEFYATEVGRVVGVHIADDALTSDGLLDVLKIRPISRLGYKDYTSVDTVFSMPKLSPEDAIGARDAAE